MKIYDCFLFNDELDLLAIRLAYLSDSVDYFVLVESERTLAGKPKKLHFEINKIKFNKYLDKIIHLKAPANDLPAWEYEYFQRNFIKQGLQNCDDNDLIVISDADEIVNLPVLLHSPSFKTPCIAQLPVYYYYFNLKSSTSFQVNLIATWSFLQNKDLGNRNILYPTYTNTIINNKNEVTGWHFSYLYGNAVKLYQDKIKSFAHHEYNTGYYLDNERIKKCILLGLDVYERSYMHFKEDDKQLTLLLPVIQGMKLDHLFYKTKIKEIVKPGNIWFILKKVYFRKIKNRLTVFFKSNKMDLY